MPPIHVDVVLVAEVIRPASLSSGHRVLRARLAGCFAQPAGVSPALILALSSRLLRCLGTARSRVDDLAAHREVALTLQMAVEVVEQRLDHARLGQLLAVQPDRLGVGDRVLEPEAQEADEGQPIAQLVLHLVSGEVVQFAEYDRLEHDDRVPGLAPSLPLALRRRPARDRLQSPRKLSHGTSAAIRRSGSCLVSRPA